ncbi:MAG: ATP-binding cassette domain-containing protein [Saprospiraceae bacterium]|jgi:ABC-2 type transport system ATP-binding protein|nr:ATP-binding cassette domain-containing protein [Saprospiraceae bacterium]
MEVLSIQHVFKSYAGHKAVNDVTFSVREGTICGLLGPNGAGKTSLIRMITAITAADEGTILFRGEPLNHLHPNEIGYMPEERGLYKKMKVAEHLLYLAQLKGLTRDQAKQRVKEWLERLSIMDWRDKKVEDLSKGMSQKIQFIATVVHNPKLIILDEPFSGLDPINANLIRDEIFRLKELGASILFSTHRMEQVEEICEDIILMNKGKVVLSGEVTAIRNAYKEHAFLIKYTGVLPESHLNNRLTLIQPGKMKAQLHAGEKPGHFLGQLLQSGLEISGFEEILPSFNEIFIKKVAETNA